MARLRARARDRRYGPVSVVRGVISAIWLAVPVAFGACGSGSTRVSCDSNRECPAGERCVFELKARGWIQRHLEVSEQGFCARVCQEPDIHGTCTRDQTCRYMLDSKEPMDDTLVSVCVERP